MNVTIGPAPCSCVPTPEQKARTLKDLAKDICLHCGDPVEPAEVELLCFCMTGPKEANPWGARVTALEACRVVHVVGQYKFVHEPCLIKAFPYLTF